jgi:fido (protein-threonine AMPylation protein)
MSLKGLTPLTPEEQADLIPSLATREELNEWERDNILRARPWALGDRQISRSDPTNEEYIRELHARMFDQTWKWAGTYWKTDKNLGIPIGEIRERVRAQNPIGSVTQFGTDSETEAGSLPAENRFGLGR